MERDVNIGIPPKETQSVIDPAVVNAIKENTNMVDSLRDELQRARRVQELILGQEVEEG